MKYFNATSKNNAADAATCAPASSCALHNNLDAVIPAVSIFIMWIAAAILAFTLRSVRISMVSALLPLLAIAGAETGFLRKAIWHHGAAAD